MLVASLDAITGTASHVLLQHRALWSHQGGTWGIPGGAIATGETALEGALREAGEEAGIRSEHIRVVGTVVLDHGMWSYTTQLAILDSLARPVLEAQDAESIELRWVPIDEVPRYELLSAFGEQWPIYLAALRRGLQRQ